MSHCQTPLRCSLIMTVDALDLGRMQWHLRIYHHGYIIGWKAWRMLPGNDWIKDSILSIEPYNWPFSDVMSYKFTRRIWNDTVIVKVAKKHLVCSRAPVPRGRFYFFHEEVMKCATKEGKYIVIIARQETYKNVALPYEDNLMELPGLGPTHPELFRQREVAKILGLIGYCPPINDDKFNGIPEFSQVLYPVFRTQPANRLYLEYRATSERDPKRIYMPILRIPFASAVNFGAQRIIGCYVGLKTPNEDGDLAFQLIYGQPEREQLVPHKNSRMAFSFGFELQFSSHTVGSMVALLFGSERTIASYQDLTRKIHLHDAM